MVPTNLQAVTVADMLQLCWSRAAVPMLCDIAGSCSYSCRCVYVGGSWYRSSRATRRSQSSWSSVVTSSPRLAW
jgi:hypothetical protein